MEFSIINYSWILISIINLFIVSLLLGLIVRKKKFSKHILFQVEKYLTEFLFYLYLLFYAFMFSLNFDEDDGKLTQILFTLYLTVYTILDFFITRQIYLKHRNKVLREPYEEIKLTNFYVEISSLLVSFIFIFLQLLYIKNSLTSSRYLISNNFFLTSFTFIICTIIFVYKVKSYFLEALEKKNFSLPNLVVYPFYIFTLWINLFISLDLTPETNEGTFILYNYLLLSVIFCKNSSQLYMKVKWNSCEFKTGKITISAEFKYI
jgi:hypothetical protein